MTANCAVQTSKDQLIVPSDLDKLTQVLPWVERMACAHAIPAHTQFAMNLCLEEILSNIIRYGYSNEPGHSITVRYSTISKDDFLLVIEDHAPPFNPLTEPLLPIEETLEGKREGGLGIRLFRSFAGNAKYESMPGGNRLSIRFLGTYPAPGEPIA